jgi:hypothetical protein
MQHSLGQFQLGLPVRSRKVVDSLEVKHNDLTFSKPAFILRVPNAVANSVVVFGLTNSPTSNTTLLSVSGQGLLTVNSSITSGGSITAGSGNITCGASGAFIWSGRSMIQSANDGQIRLLNNAQTDFGLLQFGGTTSSFPALKRNSAILECRLADDSNYAAFNCGTITGTGDATINAAGAYFWSSRSAMISPSDGVIGLYNNAVNNFTRLQLGGTTSSFPALGRSTTFLHVLLADGTAGGGILMSEGANLQVGTTTGTKIGTDTAQKLGFWNVTPVVQQVLATGVGATVDNVISLLQTLGLCKQS